MGFFTLKWSLIVTIWCLVAIVVAIVWYAYDLPSIDNLSSPSRQASVKMTDATGREIVTYGDIYGEPIRFSELPIFLIRAVIATEDRRFFSHQGFDLKALFRAIIANIRAGHIREGGSTLTQQLAKNLFLKPNRTIRRKVQELLLSFWLEANFSKEQIFTLYINRVYLGAGTFGVEAAAQRYFGKSAREVSLYEAATLAGLLKAPSRYSPFRSKAIAEKRAKLVLSRMLAAGFLSETRAQNAIRGGLKIFSSSEGSRTVRYFTDWVLERVSGFIGSIEGDIIVKTTLDLHLQKLAETRLEAYLSQYRRRKRVTQGALVTMTPSGEVRALVGGRNYKQSQYNRAFQALRQPGSAFKLFVFLAALENGIEPDDVFVDEPIKIGKWSPKNYTGKHIGRVSLREAMEKSINTVAVKVAQRIGVDKIIDVAARLGVTSKMQPHPSLALGVNEVSLLELTASYAVVANGGISVWPHAISKIRNRAGAILYNRTDGGDQEVLSPYVVGAISEMLEGIIKSGTGMLANPGFKAAGKTGTSQGFRDAWFVGYSRKLVTGVWMGNDDNTPMKGVTGGSYPARLWGEFMRIANQSSIK